jgi:hypothetical protein
MGKYGITYISPLGIFGVLAVCGVVTSGGRCVFILIYWRVVLDGCTLQNIVITQRYGSYKYKTVLFASVKSFYGIVAEISNVTNSIRTATLSEYQCVHYKVIARWGVVTVQIKQNVVTNIQSEFWLIFQTFYSLRFIPNKWLPLLTDDSVNWTLLYVSYFWALQLPWEFCCKGCLHCLWI